jgi:hypothetical protein
MILLVLLLYSGFLRFVIHGLLSPMYASFRASTFPYICKLPCISREETGADSQDGAGFTIETTLVEENPAYVKKEDGDSDNQG